MEIIPPIKLDLAPASAITTYINPEWVTETWYNIYTKVRRQYDGVWHDYQAKYTLYSTIGPPKPPYNDSQWGWRYLGLAAASSTQTYKTDFDLSANTAWSSGSSVLTGQTVFDPADHNDYIALTAITAGSNTVRPSEAVLSSDETIAGYWTLLGAANAWAALDYEMATRTQGISSGVIRTTDAGMFILPSNPSVNLIASPNNFGTGWSFTNATHSTSTENDPTNTSASISVITASGNNGVVYRTFSGQIIGQKVVFAVWARSSTITSFTIFFQDDTGVKETNTFAVHSEAWSYYQAEFTATRTGSYLTVAIGGLTTAGNNIKLWGAHFGLCADSFNRYALMGVKNCRQILVAFLPYLTPYNIWPAANAVDTIFNFPAETRRDVVRSFNRVHSYFLPGDTGSWNRTYTNTDTIYFTDKSGLYIILKPRNPAKMMEIASFAVGEATYIGGTEWGVETSMLSFSRKERNETFGTVTFVKRGTSKQVRATAFIDPDVISGDEVQTILSEFDGQPVFWDFNNEGSDYDRLRVFGFHTNVRMLIAADTYESLSLDIEGLVE